MFAPRFFSPDPLDRSIVGGEVALPETVMHHAVRVRRLKVGDALTLFDGRGGEFLAILSRIDRRAAHAQVSGYDPVERESALVVTLVLAVIATDPMEIAIRRAVELGAAEIVPVVAARSQGIGGRTREEGRHAHWQGVVVAACEQCGRNRLPVIAPLTSFGNWLRAFDGGPGSAVLLVPGAERSLAAIAATCRLRHVLVGPEGGWTEGELADCAANRIAVAHLGPRVLRSETAALAALATLNAVGCEGAD